MCSNLLVQVTDEVQHFFLAHRSLVEPEVELPQRDPRRDGKVVPVELMLQDRRHSARRPRTHPVRALAHAAFVYEDDDSALFLGFFLRAGQMFSFQSEIAASLRSRARPTGR